MLKSFSFENYKAFKEGEIEIKPITILLGPNSVGKSSILQFIMMIAQTIRGMGYKSPYFNMFSKEKSTLKLNGEYVRLGENKNIFFSGNTKESIKLCFDVDYKKGELLFSKFMDKPFGEILDEILFFLYKLSEIVFKNGDDLIDGKSVIEKKIPSDLSYKLSRIEELQNKINLHLKNNINESILEFINKSDKINLFKKNKLTIDIQSYRNAVSILKEKEKSFSDGFKISFTISLDSKNNLKLTGIEIGSKRESFIRYLHPIIGRCSLKIFSLNKKISRKIVQDIKDNLDSNNLLIFKKDLFSNLNKKNINNNSEIDVFADVVVDIISSFSSDFSELFFDNINYVSPLRAFPQRYYFIDQVAWSSFLNTIDGNKLTNILKENKKIKKNVNKWLSRFDLKVTVDKLETFVHRIKIHQNRLEFDLVDVGFGLSQVLPVIVQGFLTEEGSLTLIEQPEIHLHPRMQAELGDLFIDIAKSGKGKKRMIIETHSEYLLKRIRRRIAEGVISANDVAIYFIHPPEGNSDGAKIEKVLISKTGAFEWPRDFYCNDLEDTIEFLKYQK